MWTTEDVMETGQGFRGIFRVIFRVKFRVMWVRVHGNEPVNMVD
jgi:hypothetical protein